MPPSGSTVFLPAGGDGDIGITCAGSALAAAKAVTHRRSVTDLRQYISIQATAYKPDTRTFGRPGSGATARPADPEGEIDPARPAKSVANLAQVEAAMAAEWGERVAPALHHPAARVRGTEAARSSQEVRSHPVELARSDATAQEEAIPQAGAAASCCPASHLHLPRNQGPRDPRPRGANCRDDQERQPARIHAHMAITSLL
jgi:hypothetical protein